MRDLNIAGRDIKIDNSKSEKKNYRRELIMVLIAAAATIIAPVVGALVTSSKNALAKPIKMEIPYSSK
jgi:hypothetical protein